MRRRWSLCPQEWDDLLLACLTVGEISKDPGTLSWAFPSQTWHQFYASALLQFFSGCAFIMQKHVTPFPSFCGFAFGAWTFKPDWVEASACMSAKSFMSVWLALDKTSVRVQDFFQLVFWSLSSYIGAFAFKIHFVLTYFILGLSAWVFSCPLSQNLFVWCIRNMYVPLALCAMNNS